MTKQTLAATNVINSYSELWTEPIIPNSIHDVHINRNGGLSIEFNGNEVEVRSEEREIVSINVYNISGQLCLQKSLTLNGYSQIVSLSTLPEGTYVVKATDSEDNRYDFWWYFTKENEHMVCVFFDAQTFELNMSLCIPEDEEV